MLVEEDEKELITRGKKFSKGGSVEKPKKLEGILVRLYERFMFKKNL